MEWICIAVLAALVALLFVGGVVQQRRIDALERATKRYAIKAPPIVMDRGTI